MGAGKGLRLSRVRIEKQGEGRKQGQTPPARWGEQGRAGQGRAESQEPSPTTKVSFRSKRRQSIHMETMSQRERSPGAAGWKELWKPTTGLGGESKTYRRAKMTDLCYRMRASGFTPDGICQFPSMWHSLGDLALTPNLLHELNSP